MVMAFIAPLLTFLLLPFLSFSLPQPSSTIPLLEQTCKATTDYAFCVASLSSSPLTATAKDAKALVSIAIGLAAANASDTSAFALSQSKTASPSLSKSFGGCADKYAFARDALRSSSDAVSQENYDYANVEVSSAAEYPNVCRALFGSEYPKEMGTREEELKKLCTVSLDIISQLLNSM